MLQEINRAPQVQDRHDRGSGRVHLHPRALDHHAARDRHRHRGSPRRCAPRCARTPDVIMVGEMRDLETVDTSLKAAETGHLVFSSIHTADVISTLRRVFRSSRRKSTSRCAGDSQTTCGRSSRSASLPNKKQNGAGAGGRGAALHPLHPASASRTRKARSRSDYIDKGASDMTCRPSTSTCSTCCGANKISVETRHGAAASNPNRFRDQAGTRRRQLVHARTRSSGSGSASDESRF